jgi:tetratricopeptide (TPR) repeat protein
MSRRWFLAPWVCARLPLVTVVVLMAGLMTGAGCVKPAAKHKAAGNVLFNEKDYDGALAEYRQAESLSPDDPDTHVLVGNTLFEKDDYDGAQAEYQQALSVQAAYAPALRGLSEVAMRRNPPDVAGAISDLQGVLKQDGKDHDALAALGQLQFEAGDLKGAEDSLTRAVQLAAEDQSSLYTLGLVFIAEGDADAARNTFDRLEDVAPGTAQAPYGRAQLEAKTGQTDAALDDLAIALDRGVPDLEAVQNDQNLASLHADPRFQALLDKAKH